MGNRNGILFGLIWVVCSIFFLNACTDEIELYAPSKKIPIVYCFLDPDYSNQYVRVGQTFFYQGKDSVLQEPKLTWLDEDFDLYITYTDNNGAIHHVWFAPCSGTTRDTGLFPEVELQILSAEMPVLLNTNYKLYLHLIESGYIVFGEIKSFEQPFNVIDFAYMEFLDDQSNTKSLEFIVEMVFGEENDVGIVDKRFSGEYFLREIGRRLKSEPGIVRIPLGLDFHIWAGGEELYYLIKSYYSCDPDEKLLYRWDFDNDGFFEADWSEQARVTHSFPVEQYYFVRLEIRNSRGLENFIIKKFWVYHQNQAPKAKFTVSTYGGNTQTIIRFDSWASRDSEDSPSQMLTRWDCLKITMKN